MGEVKVGEVDKSVRRLSLAALTLALLCPALLTWSWSRAMPAPPTEMPPLTLPPADVLAALEVDASREEPTGSLADERRRIYRETNIAESAATDYPGQAEARHTRLEAAMQAVLDEAGADESDPETIAAIRSADVERGMQALHGELPQDEVLAELGRFLNMMERYGMATDGHQTAPSFVVRTALMARWNAVQGLELTDGFSPVHLRAHWGWLALHASSAPLARRLEALEAYASAGGERALEAEGVLRYDEGDTSAAHTSFVAAYAARGTFRLRNHALQARQ